MRSWTGERPQALPRRAGAANRTHLLAPYRHLLHRGHGAGGLVRAARRFSPLSRRPYRHLPEDRRHLRRLGPAVATRLARPPGHAFSGPGQQIARQGRVHGWRRSAAKGAVRRAGRRRGLDLPGSAAGRPLRSRTRGPAEGRTPEGRAAPVVMAQQQAMQQELADVAETAREAAADARGAPVGPPNVHRAAGSRRVHHGAVPNTHAVAAAHALQPAGTSPLHLHRPDQRAHRALTAHRSRPNGTTGTEVDPAAPETPASP